MIGSIYYDRIENETLKIFIKDKESYNILIF